MPAVRELTERRTMFERHYQMWDGTFRAEVHLEPIHYKAPDGSWQPIDTTLGPPAEASFAWSNKTNLLKTHLPASANGWIRVECDAGALAFRPLNGSNTASMVRDNHALQGGVWNAADLSYSVDAGVLKETITLASPAAPSSFAFALRVDGLTPFPQPNGALLFKDASGTAALDIPAPWMEDADGKRSTAIRVNLVPQGDGYVYDLTPDPSWLVKAKYPVVIDPTVISTGASQDLMAMLEGTLANTNTQYVGGTLQQTCDWQNVYTSKVGAVLDSQDGYNPKGVRTLLHFPMPTVVQQCFCKLDFRLAC